MRDTILIVPGFHGSGPAHWQSWMERRLPAARRVRGIEWEAPVLARWAAAVRREIDAAPGAVWIVAHSFGCLASVVAACDRSAKVAGLLLVALPDPERFTPLGPRAPGEAAPSLAPALPSGLLAATSVVVASRNDPWMRQAHARHWAERWGSRVVDLGPAGHINTDAGFGPWPAGLALLQALRESRAGDPLGELFPLRGGAHGRHGSLARLRHLTRFAALGRGLAPRLPRARSVRGLRLALVRGG